MSTSRESPRRSSQDVRSSILFFFGLNDGTNICPSFVVVADFRKNVEYLGTSVRSIGLPIHKSVANAS